MSFGGSWTRSMIMTMMEWVLKLSLLYVEQYASIRSTVTQRMKAVKISYPGPGDTERAWPRGYVATHRTPAVMAASNPGNLYGGRWCCERGCQRQQWRRGWICCCAVVWFVRDPDKGRVTLEYNINTTLNYNNTLYDRK